MEPNAAAASPRGEIIVLGMHRSGTSAVTGALAAMGAYVGYPEELIATSWENPKGFFERIDARQLCDGFLHGANADWWRVAGFDAGAIPPSVVQSLRPALDGMMAKLNRRAVWALKEPRMCLLMPVFEAALHAPKTVFVARHPVEVAGSLKRRNAFALSVGLALWEVYTVRALTYIADKPHVLVSYPRLLRDPVAGIGRLATGLSALGVEGLKASKARGSIQADLQREQATDPALLAEMTPQQQRLWAALEEEEWPDPADLTISAQTLETLRAFEQERDAEGGIVFAVDAHKEGRGASARGPGLHTLPRRALARAARLYRQTTGVT